MRIGTRLAATIACAISAFGTAAAATPTAPIALAPHRAVYDISLVRASSGAGVVDMNGRMVYELTGNPCIGYTQNMRFVTRHTDGEGGSQINDLRSSSWEDSAANRFRFATSQYKDDELSDRTEGDATRRDGNSVKVELKRPKRKTVALSKRVYFPVQHSIAIIEAAREGKSIFAGDLYDGSEKGEKVYETTAIIGRPGRPGSDKSLAGIENAGRLSGERYWPIAISYFEPDDGKSDAVPTYELSFRFFPNGVSTKLLIDYGDFAIKGDLKELTFLEPGRCKLN